MNVEPDALTSVRSATQRTVEQGTAEFVATRVADFPRSSEPTDGVGLLVRALRRVSAARQWSSVGSGILDFASHRCTARYQDGAMIIAGARLWRGQSGTALASATEHDAAPYQPLWVFDLVRGVVDAEQLVEHDEHEHAVYRASVDRSVASASAGYELAEPFPFAAVSHRGDSEIELEVSCDRAGLIRRIRTQTTGETSTLELVAFGTNIPIDWSVLP